MAAAEQRHGAAPVQLSADRAYTELCRAIETMARDARVHPESADPCGAACRSVVAGMLGLLESHAALGDTRARRAAEALLAIMPHLSDLTLPASAAHDASPEPNNAGG